MAAPFRRFTATAPSVAPGPTISGLLSAALSAAPGYAAELLECADHIEVAVIAQGWRRWVPAWLRRWATHAKVEEAVLRNVAVGVTAYVEVR